MNVLIVLTSHDRLGDTGQKTGFWLEELAAPYYVFERAGARITLASPRGGRPPLDPKSDLPENQTDSTRRFLADADATRRLANTKKLADVRASDFDTVFYPGGHGPMWDLAGDPTSIALLEEFVAQEKPIAAVCHAPAALTEVRDPSGEYLVKGRRVAAFTNSEERAVGLDEVVPWMLQDRLIERGADYRSGPDWKPFVQVDGRLITGQNPASSAPAAEALLKLIGEQVRS
jgi:putative intracellular protease/amidase